MRIAGILSLLLMLPLALSACGEEGAAPRDADQRRGPPPPERPPEPDIYPEVWSSNEPDGETYEFKVNCFGEFDELETCFLFDVTNVLVVGPAGASFELDKDFNINAYSGEVTRRWVLYGPPGEGLPQPGTYRFLYYRSEELVREQTVRYEPEVADYPRNVSWRREGEDLVVGWTAPEGVRPGMSYKVLVFPEDGEVISLQFEWDVSEARLAEVPLQEGDLAEVNVAVYFSGGYAKSENIPLTW